MYFLAIAISVFFYNTELLKYFVKLNKYFTDARKITEELHPKSISSEIFYTHFINCFHVFGASYTFIFHKYKK